MKSAGQVGDLPYLSCNVMGDLPLVSVVTPFHNTASFLAECIESVLAQTYSEFEYIVVDNCSSDGSYEIAESYARRDARIRLIRWTALLTQVQNYNAALAEISAGSKYCKIVQADDFIFPDCLRLMVEAFEQSESIGLVSAYDLKANVVRGSGFPLRKSPFTGSDAARLYFRSGVFVFGSPTTVMYRSSLVRETQAFFDESLVHEDTEKCFEILRNWDFGFVYQVLSFLRTGNASISAAVRNLAPDALDRYILAQRYGSVFLDEGEARERKKYERREYYDVLAQAAVHFRGAPFWRYHKAGLKTLGETIDRPYLLLQIVRALLQIVLNPGASAGRLLRYWKRRSEKN
jgi:glycosyltransferase involved in cell wall biosynthesis